jgi:hypothetical protein
MRPRRIIDKKSAFEGGSRHYHRSSNSTAKNWDAWVNGGSHEKAKSRNWLQILIITTGVIALLGLIVGLVIELR